MIKNSRQVFAIQDEENTRLDHVNQQSKKNKRKRNLIKKAQELALLGNLKVTILIKDEKMNTLQEFISCPDFTVEKIHKWKVDHKYLQLDVEKFKLLPRKSYPLKNFIEQTLINDYRKWFSLKCKMRVLGIISSPIKGSAGNVEFLICATKQL